MQAEALGSDDDEEDDGEAPKPTSTKGKEREKPEWEAHPKPIIQSRANKHAYVSRNHILGLLSDVIPAL